MQFHGYHMPDNIVDKASHHFGVIYNFHYRVLASISASTSIALYTLIETAEREVHDASCRGSGGVPPAFKVPQDWGIRGLIESISEVSC